MRKGDFSVTVDGICDQVKVQRTYCGTESGFEGVTAKPVDEAALANARVSHKHNFEHTLRGCRLDILLGRWVEMYFLSITRRVSESTQNRCSLQS